MLDRPLSAKRTRYVTGMRVLMALSMLFTAALVLFLFIMMINGALNFFLKRDKEG